MRRRWRWHLATSDRIGALEELTERVARDGAPQAAVQYQRAKQRVIKRPRDTAVVRERARRQCRCRSRVHLPGVRGWRARDRERGLVPRARAAAAAGRGRGHDRGRAVTVTCA